MGTKTTRSNSEIKAIIAEICNNKDFLQGVFEYVEKCNSKINEQRIDPVLETVNFNSKIVEELRKENEILKSTIEDLKSEILSLKLEQQPSVERNKSSNKKESDKNKPQKKQYVEVVAGTSTAVARDDESASRTTSVQRKEDDQHRRNDNVNTRRERNSKKMTQPKTVGAALNDRSGGLLIGVSHAKTAWLYVGKIKNTEVKEEDIHKYISDEEGNITISVEKLKTKGPYAAFKVGVPFELLKKLTAPEYWPSGVVVRRFNFWSSVKLNQKVDTFLDKRTTETLKVQG